MEKTIRRGSKGYIALLVATGICAGGLFYDNQVTKDKLEESENTNSIYQKQVNDLTKAYKTTSEESENMKIKAEENFKLYSQEKLENDKLKDEVKKLEKKVSSYPTSNKVIVSSSSSSSVNYESTMTITAYTAGYESTQKKKGEKGYGITASGTTVKEGRTVACSKSIPFGTVVEIEGIGKRICEDRGGAITENHIDLYVEHVGNALDFGRRKLVVKVYK